MLKFAYKIEDAPKAYEHCQFNHKCAGCAWEEAHCEGMVCQEKFKKYFENMDISEND